MLAKSNSSKEALVFSLLDQLHQQPAKIHEGCFLGKLKLVKVPQEG